MDKIKYKKVDSTEKIPSLISYKICKSKIIVNKSGNLYENTLSLFFENNKNSNSIPKDEIILNDNMFNRIKILTPKA